VTRVGPRPLPVLGASALAAHARTLDYCTYCPKMCRHACPVAVAEGSEAATPTWKAGLATLWRRGRLALRGAVAEAGYRCTDCGLAEKACLHGIDPPDHLQPVRDAAYAAGVAPGAVLSYAARVRRLGNPFAADLAGRLRAHVPAARLAPDGAGGPLLFPGCTATRHAPQTIGDALAAVDLTAAQHEAPVGVSARGAGCCGLPLHLAGDVAGFRDLATRVFGALRGASAVLALDPGCVHALNVLYRAHGLDLGGRARTVVEHLAGRVGRVAALVRTPVPEPPAYHDPCYLGRRRGAFEPPRALLAAVTAGGRRPLEPATSRELAFCSGAGGIYGKAFPDGAKRVVARRVREIEETGATTIATACPSCVRGLGEASEREVVDVVTLVARAMGEDAAPQASHPGSSA